MLPDSVLQLAPLQHPPASTPPIGPRAKHRLTQLDLILIAVGVAVLHEADGKDRGILVVRNLPLQVRAASFLIFGAIRAIRVQLRQERGERLSFRFAAGESIRVALADMGRSAMRADRPRSGRHEYAEVIPVKPQAARMYALNFMFVVPVHASRSAPVYNEDPFDTLRIRIGPVHMVHCPQPRQ